MMAAFFNLMFFGHASTRKIILAFSIFIIFGIVYDLMRAYPNYLVHGVDIRSLYNFEKHWFGISVNQQVLTPNEFFALHHQALMDFICGLFYVNWISVPLALALYLYLKNKEQFLNFSLTFLMVNLLGFCLYYIHPAAPPWYVAQYGFEFRMHIPGNTAGLSRFDNLIHIPVFATIYTQNSNVFASLPSLHSAYPVVVLFYALQSHIGKFCWALGVFMLGIWFTAVYSGHHYITDVILGILCAIAGIAIYQFVILRSLWFRSQLENYIRNISNPPIIRPNNDV